MKSLTNDSSGISKSANKIRYSYAEMKCYSGTYYLRVRRIWQVEQLKGEGIERGFTIRKCGWDDVFASFGRPKVNGERPGLRWLETPRRGVFVCMGHESLPTPAPLAQGARNAVTLLSASA